MIRVISQERTNDKTTVYSVTDSLFDHHLKRPIMTKYEGPACRGKHR